MYDLDWLLARTARKQKTKYLYFWGHRPTANGTLSDNCLSQWWASPFEVDGVRYATAEHWMMAGKARLFGDDGAADRIVEASHPILYSVIFSTDIETSILPLLTVSLIRCATPPPTVSGCVDGGVRREPPSSSPPTEPG